MRLALCPVLIGRDPEARHLRVALQGARTGRGSMVLVTGEPGIGKSRLVREIAEDARQRGCVVTTGRAVGGGVPTPFRPFAEALSSALRPGGLPESAALDPFLPALGRLVPHLRAESAGADGSLVFLGEAVQRLLRVLAAGHGCLRAVTTGSPPPAAGCYERREPPFRGGGPVMPRCPSGCALGVTGQEAEVLRLLTGGLTNREIAEQGQQVLCASRQSEDTCSPSSTRCRTPSAGPCTPTTPARRHERRPAPAPAQARSRPPRPSAIARKSGSVKAVRPAYTRLIFW